MTEKNVQKNKLLSFKVDNHIDIPDKKDLENIKPSKKDKTLNMELHHHMAPPGGIIDDLD